jgi:hypothetical protein
VRRQVAQEQIGHHRAPADEQAVEIVRRLLDVNFTRGEVDVKNLAVCTAELVLVVSVSMGR